jgi:hypothetical protein
MDSSYGDMYPFTYCGRAVSVMVAIMGGFWIGKFLYQNFLSFLFQKSERNF